MTELWRGFANMAATAGREVVIAKGRGSTVWDDKGKAYLDSTASLWYMNVGYGRDEIADAVGAQLKELAAFHTFGPFANPPLLKLADKVAELSAMDGAAVFFTSGGGSDAVDTAAKLARRYWNAIGRPEKQIIISREHGYHGTNAFGTSLQGIPANRDGYGDLMPHIENIPWGDADALEAPARGSRRSHRRLHRRARDRRRRRDPAARRASGRACRSCAASTTCC